MITRQIAIILLSILLVPGCDSLTRAKHAIQGIEKITPAELKEQLNDKDITILDVRDDGDWDTSNVKIPGAKRESPYTATAWMGNYQKDQKLALYWAWPAEQTSARVARQLEKAGFTNVKVLKGGWLLWQELKYPVQEK